jgi:hypothetical protein
MPKSTLASLSTRPQTQSELTVYAAHREFPELSRHALVVLAASGEISSRTTGDGRLLLNKHSIVAYLARLLHRDPPEEHVSR